LRFCPPPAGEEARYLWRMRTSLFSLAWILAIAAIGQSPVTGIPLEDRGTVEGIPDPEGPVEEPVYTVVEQSAEFPGGQAMMMKYLAQHMRYPEQAIDAGIEGKVYVRFVVDQEGHIGDAQVMRGMPGSGCDAEALRVVRSMPNWTPAMQRGKKVKMAYTLPIVFKLNEPAPTSK